MHFEKIDELARFCHRFISRDDTNSEDSGLLINYLFIIKNKVIWTNSYFMIKWKKEYTDWSNGVYLIKQDGEKIILKKQSKGQEYITANCSKVNWKDIIKLYKYLLKENGDSHKCNDFALDLKYINLISKAISKRDDKDIYPMRIKIPSDLFKPIFFESLHGKAFLMQIRNAAL